MEAKRLPVIYIPHGGGPWPIIDMSGFRDPGVWERLSAYLKTIGNIEGIKKILVISSHWENHKPTILMNSEPPMLYDYYGFPEEAYEFVWPAKGSPILGNRIAGLLKDANIEFEIDDERGFDHGTFIPLSIPFPNGEIPTIQLSLQADLDPELHLKIGKALTPLRNEGVLIIGSGMSFHNLHSLLEGSEKENYHNSNNFNEWIIEALESDDAENKLINWSTAPSANYCHPREEHLMPLMVVTGASDGDNCSIPYRDRWGGAEFIAIQFG